MYRKRLGSILLYLLCFWGIPVHAQEYPHLQGKIEVNAINGFIKCELTITNFPQYEDPVFVLNKGMNIQYIKLGNRTIPYNTDYGLHTRSAYLNEGLAYSPVIDSITKKMAFQLKYTGAFPVYGNDVSDNAYDDDQGKIVFKNKILRASYMTKLCPFLYDRSTGNLMTKYSYDLQVSLKGFAASTIIINENLPKNGANCNGA